jgi:DNA-binding response OmpR family regulator
MRVFIVEDAPEIAELLAISVQEAGYEAVIEEDGLKALETASQEPFKLILLDVVLPGMNGLDICRNLRAQGIDTPILILTSRDTLEDKVEGLDAGADDYIIKPFEIPELLARVRALLRRGTALPQILHVGDLSLDLISRKAFRDGKSISLSTTEFSLLEFLMRHAGNTLTRAQLLDHVWQYDFGGNDNVLDCYISYLRHKIDKNQSLKLIHTVRGIGFRLGEEVR